MSERSKFNEVTNSNRIQLVNKVFSQNGLCAMRTVDAQTPNDL